MPQARLAVSADLKALIEVLRHANPDMPALPFERSREIFDDILTGGYTTIFVADRGERIVASCTLITAPNLMRGGRRHGFLENVVTHADFRRQGHGRAVVTAALAKAWADDCHHVMLQSGRPDPGVHRFYEACGFVPDLRTAYVTPRPDGFL